MFCAWDWLRLYLDWLISGLVRFTMSRYSFLMKLNVLQVGSDNNEWVSVRAYCVSGLRVNSMQISCVMFIFLF